MQHKPSPSRRVLLADDDPALRMLLGQIIKSFGFEVIYAENGSKALALYLQHRNIDLLITDICMPEMDGDELIRSIRQMDAGLPIIAITGYAEQALIQRIDACHARLFEKPLNFNLLHSYIDSLEPLMAQRHRVTITAATATAGQPTHNDAYIR